MKRKAFGEITGNEPIQEVGMRVLYTSLVVGVVLGSAAANAQQIDWQKVDDTLGRKPAAVAGDVHRYGFRAPIFR